MITDKYQFVILAIKSKKIWCGWPTSKINSK